MDSIRILKLALELAEHEADGGFNFEAGRRYHRIADLIKKETGVDPRPNDLPALERLTHYS